MRTGVTVDVSPADRERLISIASDRNSPQKHAWRARIVLLTSEGRGVEIMRVAGVAKTAVWRWQDRFMHEGVDGLLRDKTRPPRCATLSASTSTRRRMPWCSRLTRRARSKRSIAPSPACRSGAGAAAP